MPDEDQAALGCSKCRYSQRGCKRCRDPGFQAKKRDNLAEPCKPAKRHKRKGDAVTTAAVSQSTMQESDGNNSTAAKGTTRHVAASASAIQLDVLQIDKIQVCTS